jgi:hypothetical protein
LVELDDGSNIMLRVGARLADLLKGVSL